MELPSELEAVEGATKLRDWFGYWPGFHDAEVISLHLDRSAPSSLVVHTWETTKDVDERGYCVMTKHVLVEFLMNEVSGLTLNGFNEQNVIFGLEIERAGNGYRLTLEDCYGIAGSIESKDISIRLTPGRPKEPD